MGKKGGGSTIPPFDLKKQLKTTHMKKYFLIRFTYHKEEMGDNAVPAIIIAKKRLFVEAIGYDAACRKIVRKYPTAHKFQDLTIR